MAYIHKFWNRRTLNAIEITDKLPELTSNHKNK